MQTSTNTQKTPKDSKNGYDGLFWKAIFALAVGGFSIGTGEFVIMGLLPEVAANVDVSIPDAGNAISAYAVGVTVGAPLLALVTATFGRHALVCALMAAFAIGNFFSASATSYQSLLALRFFTGLPHGTYFGVAALIAAALAPAGRRASAIGYVMTGLTTATLVGVPFATWLGQLFGWRAAFILVGAIASIATILIWIWVPKQLAHQQGGLSKELGALTNVQVLLTLAIGAIGFGGMFTVLTYVKPLLTEVSGFDLKVIPYILGLFGLGMFFGNLIGGKLADRNLNGTIAGVLLWNTAILAAVVFTAPNKFAICINIFLLGTVVAIEPALQIRLMDVAGRAQTLAAALNHSAFNMANALGAWLGGMAIASGLGWASTGWVGTGLAVGGIVIFAAAIVLSCKAEP